MTRMKEIEITLNDPIEMAVGGTMKSVDTVLLIAPSAGHQKHAGRLKRICASTMLKESRKTEGAAAGAVAKDEDASKLEWSDMVNILASAGDDNDILDDVYRTFFRLLNAGCGTIEGEQITQSVFDSIAFDDLERLFGEYAVNFLMSSLTQKKDGKR